VIVTSSFFADAFTVADGKINVLGGVWDWYRVQAVGDGIAHSIAMIEPVA
jgi:hypothetical protein